MAMLRNMMLALPIAAAVMLMPLPAAAVQGCDYMRDVISKPKVQKDFLAHYRYARDLPVSYDGELKRKNEKLLANYKVDGKTFRLDKRTIKCLECHDEMLSLGTDKAGHEIVQKNFHALIGSHALGLDYFKKSQEMPSVFLPPDPNRNNVIFIGGRLGCLSCHNPFSKLPFHLNASESDGSLCEQCHRR